MVPQTLEHKERSNMKNKKAFKLCSDCPTPGACSAAGKCMGKSVKKMAYGGMVKKGYAKGGYVACGASNPGTQGKKR